MGRTKCSPPLTKEDRPLFLYITVAQDPKQLNYQRSILIFLDIYATDRYDPSAGAGGENFY
jgi:hypothetical protein